MFFYQPFQLLAELPPVHLAWVVGILGLVVGSFLNVVIYRLPQMMERTWKTEAIGFLRDKHPDVLEEKIRLEPFSEDSTTFNLAQPRSRCSSCGHTLTWRENIPIISWCWLKARCRACGSAISIRYVLIESLTALTSAWIAYRYGWTPVMGVAFLFNAVLICAFWIDWDTQLLPDDLTLPLVWGGLIAAYSGMGMVPFPDAFWGAIAGYGILWAVFWIFYLLFKKEGMGYGDFKLLSALGAWLGWSALPAILFVASVGGVLYGVLRSVTGWSSPSEKTDKKIEEGLSENSSHGWSRPLPFGPFLIAAGWVIWMVLPPHFWLPL